MNTDAQYMYDIVLPVGPEDYDTAGFTLNNIFKYFSFRKLYIVSAAETFKKIRLTDSQSEKTIFIDESTVIKDVGLPEIKKICGTLFNDTSRGGWYFQQFLKMGICQLPTLSDHYLVWDADTIPLKTIHFFDENGRVLYSFKTDTHQPYFNTLKKIIGIDKQVDYSFITEHMMIKKAYMQELLKMIGQCNAAGNNWIEKIMNSIAPEEYVSGFSEFESYGNFIAKFHPYSFAIRKIKHKRSGSKITKSPNVLLLFLLSFFRDTVSFEKGHT